MKNTFKVGNRNIIFNRSIQSLIILLIAFTGVINAQSTFKWGFDRSDKNIIDYYEIRPDNYIFVGGISETEKSSKYISDSAWIFKWNLSGDSINRKIKPGGVSDCYFTKVNQCKNGNLLALGCYESPNTLDTSGFFAVYYDSLLNVKWTTQLTLPRRWVSARTAVKTWEGDWIVGLYTKNYDWYGGNGINQGYLVKMSENGEILKVVSDTISDLQQVMMHPDSTRIYCLGDYLEIPGIETDAWLKEYDFDLNFISQKPIITSFTINAERFHGKWIAEDTMLLAGLHGVSSSYWSDDLVLNKLIDGDSLISAKEQRYFYEGEDYMYENRAIAITKDRKIILTCGVGGFTEEKGFIGRYNMNLDPLNYWIFDDDPNYIFKYLSPLATSDSGFIVKLNKTTYNNSLPDSAFIIKFDKEGPFVGIDNPVGIKQTNHLLYPNPGYNEVHLELTKSIRQKGEVCFELYTLQGIKAGQWNTMETRTLINTSNLPPGVYLYRITRQGKQLASGKWVKQ